MMTEPLNANLDGSGREVLIRRLDPEGIAIHAGKMYWSDYLLIERANLDGSSRQVLISNAGVPGQIVIVPSVGHAEVRAVTGASGAGARVSSSDWEARAHELKRIRAERIMAEQADERAAAGLPRAR